MTTDFFRPDSLYEMSTPGTDYRFYGKNLLTTGSEAILTRWDEKRGKLPGTPHGKWVSREGFFCFPGIGAKITLVSDDGSDK